MRLERGRAFLPAEDRRGSPVRVAVVAHAFWQNRLNADASVVGKSITLNGSVYTVIGVAPPQFVGAAVGRAPDVWVPMALQQEVRPPTAGLRRSLGNSDLLGTRGPRWLSAVGRLKPGSDLAHTLAGLDVVARRLQAAYPDTNASRAFNAVPLGEGPGVRASSRPLLRLLGASVFLVLLIACANVASLLLARSVSRRREVAIRMAVGAGHSRLVRQWLTESVLLALLGGLGGVVLANWGAPLLHLAGIPETVNLGLNGRVLAFTFAVAAGSGILFGLAPVLQTLHTNPISALRDEGGAVATGQHASRLRRAFVVFQVAVSLMLLVGAGLFLRTLRNAHAVDLGYGLDTTLVADINLDVRGYSEDAGQVAYQQILERLRATPGVATAGAARVTVLSGGARTVSVSVDGRPLLPDASNGLDVRVNVISDGYLDALRIPVLRGRDFTVADGPTTLRVSIVSRSLAARLWPNDDPIGKQLITRGTPTTVVGLVPDTVYRNALEREPPPFYYLPLAQNYESGVTLHVRASQGDPLMLVPGVRAAVRARGSPCRGGPSAKAAQPLRSVHRLAAHDGDARRSVRWDRAAACGRRPVRSDGATRRATTHGNRHSPRARRPPTGHSLDDSQRRIESRGFGGDHRTPGGIRGVTLGREPAVWRPFDRSPDVCRRLPPPARIGRHRVRDPRAARHARRSSGSAQEYSDRRSALGGQISSCRRVLFKTASKADTRARLPLSPSALRATSPLRSTAEPFPSAACRSRRCRSARRRGRR